MYSNGIKGGEGNQEAERKEWWWKKAEGSEKNEREWEEEEEVGRGSHFFQTGFSCGILTSMG